MKAETLNALKFYIETVNEAIHIVADIGPGANLEPLDEATERLMEAIENES